MTVSTATPTSPPTRHAPFSAPVIAAFDRLPYDAQRRCIVAARRISPVIAFGLTARMRDSTAVCEARAEALDDERIVFDELEVRSTLPRTDIRTMQVHGWLEPSYTPLTADELLAFDSLANDSKDHCIDTARVLCPALAMELIDRRHLTCPALPDHLKALSMVQTETLVMTAIHKRRTTTTLATDAEFDRYTRKREHVAPPRVDPAVAGTERSVIETHEVHPMDTGVVMMPTRHGMSLTVQAAVPEMHRVTFDRLPHDAQTRVLRAMSEPLDREEYSYARRLAIAVIVIAVAAIALSVFGCGGPSRQDPEPAETCGKDSGECVDEPHEDPPLPIGDAKKQPDAKHPYGGRLPSQEDKFKHRDPTKAGPQKGEVK